MLKSIGFACVCILAMLAVGCGSKDSAGASTGGGATPGKLTIAVIPKGTTHAYWKSVEAGARAAGTDLGVTIQWKGPLQEDDRAGQIAVVEEFITDKVDGIVLAPLDDTALQRPVASAMSAKIPVVIIDSALKGDAGKDFVSFVATNNLQGGEMAGEQLAKVLNGKGNIVLLRYVEGSASTNDRETGFLDAISKHPDMHMLVDNRYGGATEAESQTAALNLSDQLAKADGVFCPNESSTLGMLSALKKNNLAGKVHFVGFDATPREVEALQAGDVDALVAQDPQKMGYEGVKAVVDQIRGTPPAVRIDSGVALITKDNLNTPDIQKLLGTNTK
jgi:ribose transport system substrate-binding protein